MYAYLVPRTGKFPLLQMISVAVIGIDALVA
jgi:hypothetical protein